MCAVLIVVGPPCFDDVFGVGVAGEDAFVQALVAQAAIEAFNKAVLHELFGAL